MHIVDCRSRLNFAPIDIGELWRPNYHVATSRKDEILAEIFALTPDVSPLQVQALQSLVKGRALPRHYTQGLLLAYH